MSDSKIKIGFSLNDGMGNEFSSTSELEVYTEMGVTEIEVIGEQFNSFLRQAGYFRPNDFLFMEDITEEEKDALSDCLKSLRSNSENE